MKKKQQFAKNILDAWQQAMKTRQYAYAPYSKFKVGSALKFKKSSEIYVGCNFENASFGATICAERNALGAAVAAGQLKKTPNALEFVLVIADTKNATPPCGLCLQALSEFADDETDVYLATLEGIVQKAKFRQFLPTPFKTIEL